jgi:hypothetical protein
MNHIAVFKTQNSMVGESLNEERNQEGSCEEKGRPEKEEVISASR